MSESLLPTLYLSHGGGPWPWMDGPMRKAHRGLEQALAALPAQLGPAPRAVLMVSAHWEEVAFTLGASAAPALIFDYHGFPEHTYRIAYAAPGAPELASHACQLLRQAGIKACTDPARGLDHGAFVPMRVMYPEAGMPLVQLSLKRGLDPAEHLAAGRALAALRREGVLILGSGSSYHDLANRGPGALAPSQAFDGWLQQVLVDAGPAERESALKDWEQAPAARRAHPREEHLLPLMVAAGAAAGEPGRCIYREERFFGISTVSSYRFGAG